MKTLITEQLKMVISVYRRKRKGKAVHDKVQTTLQPIFFLYPELFLFKQQFFSIWSVTPRDRHFQTSK
jgi:hypothetical protein